MKKSISLMAFSTIFNYAFSQTNETLHSVTERGNNTSNIIQITQGNHPPLTGKGLEIYGYESAGVVQAYDRDNSTWLPLALNPGGKVGVGTMSPSYKLHIAAGNDDGILIGNYNDRLGWEGNGQQPGYHIRFAGYRDVINSHTGAKISALRTNTCCNALATGMDLAFYTSLTVPTGGDGSLNEIMRLKDNGNVGIGTNSPAYKLDVAGQSYAAQGFSSGGANPEGLHMAQDNAFISGWNNSNNVRTGFLQFNTGNNITLNAENGAYLCFSTGPSERLRIEANGNVGIGTQNTGSYKLAVEGTIGARKVKVTQENWSDYVFAPSYQLPTLSQVETFIKEKKHLPDIPSAAEVKKEGLDIGDNQAMLLRKIEELTLYIIQQNKEISQMRQEITELKDNRLPNKSKQQ